MIRAASRRTVPSTLRAFLVAAVSALGMCAVPGCPQGGGLFARRNTFLPADEPWAILCAEYRGSGCQAAAEDVATGLRKTPGIAPDKVLVQGDPQHAVVVYGPYTRKIDPHSRERADMPADMKRDLQLIRGLRDHEGNPFFLGARFIPMPGASDAGRADWDLRNVNAVYTLQVAAYYNTETVPDRKLAAVEKVKALRDQGYDAYYFHGEGTSMVTVGRFGENAVIRKQGKGARANAVERYSSEVESLQRRPECMYNLTNDDVWYNVDSKGRKVPVRSMLVRVPRGGALR